MVKIKIFPTHWLESAGYIPAEKPFRSHVFVMQSVVMNAEKRLSTIGG